jgi:DNA-binding response OmpR family regulator
MKILLADDDDNFRTLLSEILEGEGYEVTSHENGQRAWEYLQSDTADIVVSDVNMPEMGGFELLKLIREDARLAAIPVLMMTVRDTVTDQVAGYETGADDYLPKPFANEVLVARVKVLERRILGAA